MQVFDRRIDAPVSSSMVVQITVLKHYRLCSLCSLSKRSSTHPLKFINVPRLLQYNPMRDIQPPSCLGPNTPVKSRF